MVKNLKLALNAMKKIGVPIFENYSDGSPLDVDEKGRACSFAISGEDPESYKWVNYYGYSECLLDDDDGCPWIDEKLEAIADKYGCVIEWYDPGSLRVYAW